jgi:hypothetical protein
VRSCATNATFAERRFDRTEIGAAKAVTVTELTAVDGSTATVAGLADGLGLGPDFNDLIEQETYESIYNTRQTRAACLLAQRAARQWQPRASQALQALRHRQVRVVRDYGMFDRREAPQFYADVRHKG